jgi:hypothetical protein
MSDLDRLKLAQLLGMTGSVHDGEALNAMRAANRALRAAGKTWKDVIQVQDEAKRFTEQEVQAAMRRAYESGYADGMPQPQSQSMEPQPIEPQSVKTMFTRFGMIVATFAKAILALVGSGVLACFYFVTICSIVAMIANFLHLNEMVTGLTMIAALIAPFVKKRVARKAGG